ncbi:MAG: cation:proton antiporter [Acidimicrobiia bacterium]|nr:cation:proton antiporter [Acidimicrobiia bacterium]
MMPEFAFFLAGGPEALRIPLAMLIVFGAAKLLAELFELFHQPGLVGEILAGILIGPGVLNWVQPDNFLSALAELGVMFLLFRVGLEVKASELLKVGTTAAVVGIMGVLLPFGAGWGILSAFGGTQIECIFLGAAMVATSVGITARVLDGKGLLQHVASQTILAAAVIDDVLGLLVLAVVSSMAKGSVNMVEIGVTAGLAIGFTVLVTIWGTRTMEKVVPQMTKLRSSEAQFSVAMVVLFSLSVLAVYAGVAAIVGAFLAGVALAESTTHRVHDLAQGVTELLVPFFLAGIGLHLELSSMTAKATIILSVLVLVAAVVSKLVGCGLGALPMGRVNAIRVGVGMVPRGEVGMVVAQIGLGLGAVSQSIYGVVVFMSVLTTIIAPPLLSWAYRGEEGPPKQRFTLG